MSWIDIFLSDGDPHKVYGADAEKALKGMFRFRDIPFMWVVYKRAGFGWRTRLIFMFFDIIRNVSYRRGFIRGKTFKWPDEPTAFNPEKK